MDGYSESWDPIRRVRWIHMDCVDSTNSFLQAYTPTGDELLTVATAAYQTAGRGQGSNKWESEAGSNVTMSVLSRGCGVKAGSAFLLSMAGALAVKRGIEALNDEIRERGLRVKWPNDIYWGDDKVSGTLIESKIGGELVKRVVFGIGINVNQKRFHSDAPNPLSLCQIVGHEWNREEVMESVVNELWKLLKTLSDGDYESVRTAYLEALYRREGYHAYADENGTFQAETAGLTDEGRLLLQREDGSLRAYGLKEVRFLIEKGLNN